MRRREVDITAGSVTVRATDRGDVRVRTARTYAFLKPSTSADLDDGELHLKGTKDIILDLQTSAGDIELAFDTAPDDLDLRTSAGSLRPARTPR